MISVHSKTQIILRLTRLPETDSLAALKKGLGK